MLRKIFRGDHGPELQQYFPLRNDSTRRGHYPIMQKRPSGKLPARFRLSHRAVNLWNSLPASVVEEKDENFKYQLDEHLRNMWSREFI